MYLCTLLKEHNPSFSLMKRMITRLYVCEKRGGSPQAKDMSVKGVRCRLLHAEYLL